MIISRPQKSTLVSFILFLGIAYFLLGVNIYVVAVDLRPQWFNYLVLVILVPVSSFVTYKVFFQYKIIRMGDRQIIVRYPQFRNERKYKLEEVVNWEETVVKTGKSASYRELEINFQDRRTVKMGHREYTEYDKMVNYLSQKIPKARRSKAQGS